MNRNRQPERGSRPLPRSAWIGLIALGIVATIASYLLVDPIVTKWLAHHPSTWHRNLWVDAFRQAGKGGVPIWLILAWSCLTNRWRPTVAVVLALILVGVSVGPIKMIVRRSRPHMVVATSQQSSESESQSATPQDRVPPWRERVSFPSGDTAVVFAAATALSFSLGWSWAPLFFAAAGAIGLLRITALAHYPSDVVAGAAIGILCSLIALRWIADRRELEEFRVEVKWRLIAILVLVFVMPFLSPYLGMPWLQAFLRVYLLPLAALALVYMSISRLRARRRSGLPSRDIEIAMGEGSGSPTRKPALGGPSPVQDVARGNPNPFPTRSIALRNPAPTPDRLKEPTA
jgi:membrane-associated phospholipid phosphatase